MTNNERIKALEKDVKRLQEQVDELENACVEHEAWIRKLQNPNRATGIPTPKLPKGGLID